MRIALVQLSDIHIADPKNEVLARAAQIRAAVRSCVEFPEVVVLLYTGDIAYSAKSDQYGLASQFCSALKSHFDTDGIELHEIFVPGNHDVDVGDLHDELIDMHVPPGGGPPPYRHDFEESFTLLEGELEVTFRGSRRVVRAG